MKGVMIAGSRACVFGVRACVQANSTDLQRRAQIIRCTEAVCFKYKWRDEHAKMASAGHTVQAGGPHERIWLDTVYHTVINPAVRRPRHPSWGVCDFFVTIQTCQTLCGR